MKANLSKILPVNHCTVLLLIRDCTQVKLTKLKLELLKSDFECKK